MNETWIGVALSVVALLGVVANNVNARKLAHDKQVGDRDAARDKMEFDATLSSLKAGQLVSEQRLAECEKRHDRCEELSLKAAADAREDGRQMREVLGRLAAGVESLVGRSK